MKYADEQLIAIYEDFESQAAPHKSQAACQKGCAYCCTDAGAIDVTTQEGLIIKSAIEAMPRPRQGTLKKALAGEMKKREKGLRAACPFLMKNKACMIYAVRPFACRRIYSLKKCSAQQPALLSRQVMALGDQAIKALQQLDQHGYSGHLTYILHMLEAPRFLETYLAGACKPEEVKDFGKSHQIFINRMALD